MSEHGPRVAGTLAKVTRGAASTTACASALAHEDREDGSSSINPVNISTNRGCCGRSEAGGHAGFVIFGKILAKRQVTQDPPGFGDPKVVQILNKRSTWLVVGKSGFPWMISTPRHPSDQASIANV